MATDYLDVAAELGSEDDEDYDDENGNLKTKPNGVNGANRHLHDSSDEDDEEEDEEAERAVREGFIVDEDEEEEGRQQRKRERKKRRREEREEENLDEEDLDLIGELAPRPPTESKFKRLKRGHRDDKSRAEVRGVDEIFSDENEDQLDEIDDRRPSVRGPRDVVGEFDDFIEEDEFPDEQRDQMLDDIEVSRRPKKGLAAITGMQSGLDEAGMEDMRAAFGDGTEYDWALELQEAMDDEQADLDKPLELKDVFEPSQLAEKMLTDEDNIIRSTDLPERFQLARMPFAEPDMTDEEAAKRTTEEALWISNFLWPKKRFESSLLEPFRKSVSKVLEFMNVEDFEVPFIFQHRKDYLIYAGRVPKSPDPANPNAPDYELKAEKLLNQGDLWEILDLDLKFRALVEKRNSLKKSFDMIKTSSNIQDDMVEEMLPRAVTMEEIQDIQDYVQFQYAAQLKDVQLHDAETVGIQKRARAPTTIYERIRTGKTYNVVRAFGITADTLAKNVIQDNRRGFTEDPHDKPEDMADQYVDAADFSTGAQVLRAAKLMFAEEIFASPRMRKFARTTYFVDGVFDCVRTEKGFRKIDEDHPYYEFKYLRNQNLQAFARQPELYLRMLKAEEEGLVELVFRLPNETTFKRSLVRNLESDNFSEVADAWNVARRDVLDMALTRIRKIMVKSVKENLKTECENQMARRCREEYLRKLDQAPFKPKAFPLGSEPRVLALTNGSGVANRDATIWAYVDRGGMIMEHGKYSDLRLGNAERMLPDAADVAKFIELVERRKPDVIAVSGFSVEARALYKDIQTIVDQHDLRCDEYEDDDGHGRRDKFDVVQVNDEVARLYHISDRSTKQLPGLAPLTKYCVGLARYMQNPMKEYAALGHDITSISFHPHQNLIPKDKLLKHLETAMVDMVNLVGVEINDAVQDLNTASLLPYVCGLGPRKAAALLQAVNRNGGNVTNREELVGDPENNKLQAVGPKVWANCASFLCIEYEAEEPAADYLDSTRVHPEDYELGRKMAADALELDEEDIKAEVDENGPGAVVRRLVREEAQERVNDLILEMYAEQLEQNFNQRKRATLETIRAELQDPYEELRKNFAFLSTDEIFTMLTGETRDSLVEGMVIPVSIKRIFPDHIDVRLDCGIEGGISESEYPAGVGMDGIEPRQAFQVHQTVQAKLMYLNRKQLTAQLSFREDALRRTYRKDIDRQPGEWDEAQEDLDKREASKRKDDVTGRAQRVIKHPLFRPMSATQAEEFLGPQGRGDVLIRPSSKGLDHLAVTWKVSDNVFQHIDVLELDKENEFSVGRTLKIGGKYTYTDLDELIVNHVKAMAKKVDEIMSDERYQKGSKAQTEQWLTAYMEANPKRSMYAFCINREFPGYFYLCFKAGQNSKQMNWPIKIIPNAFELQKNPYPDMRALKNGFKTIFTHMQQNGKRRY